MKSVILAAGYGTRMGDVAKNMPKALLSVGGERILEHIVKRIPNESKEINIVTNSRFIETFSDWYESFNSPKRELINLIDDGSIDNEHRTGAIKDMLFGLEYGGEDDSLIIASDNLFDFSLEEIASEFNKKYVDTIVATEIKDWEKAKLFGVLEVNKDGLITSFQEKPQYPKTTLISTGIYFLKKRTIPLVKDYVNQNGNNDKMGNLIEWMIKIKPVYCIIPKGKWYDIGNIECYEKAQEEWAQKN